MNRPQIFAVKDVHAFLAHPAFSSYSGASECIVVSSMDGMDGLIRSQSIEAVSLPDPTQEDKKKFIQDYTQLIASLNSRFRNDLLWWATDISSKNRYTSPLPDLVQEFWEIQKIVGEHPGKPLLLVAPSIAIHGSLQKALTQQGRRLVWPGVQARASFNCCKGAIKESCRTIYRALRFYGRALLSWWSLRTHARQRLSVDKQYYVVKTFSYASSWDSQGLYTDSFFGRLPHMLSQKKNVLVWSYHWTGFRDFIKRIQTQKDLTIFPIEFFLKGEDIMAAVFKIFAFRAPVREEVRFRGFDISDILRYELARTMNGIQIFQLLHYDATRNLLKELEVEDFLFTFENNPWERMCILACRHHGQSTRIIGCQNQVVPEAALNMFFHSLEKDIVPLPDKILTSGETPKRIIQEYSNEQLPLASACAWRYEYLLSIKPASRRKSQGHLLLVLDGVEQTGRMLTFVLGQLEGNRHYRLRIRCHPALPWDLLSHKFRLDITPYANVEVSREALKEDLDWSDMIIYWQSAVVLEALSLGKPSINFKPHEILSYDPLFESDALKWTLTEEGRLTDVIAAIELMDENSYQKQLQQALIYIKDYFSPASAQAIVLLSS